MCACTGRKLYEGLRDNLFASPGVWSLEKCSNPGCALLWLNPAPHPDDLPLLYEDYYTHGETDGSSILLRFAGWSYRVIAGVLLAPFGVFLDRSRARRMFIQAREPGTLLDIGCGDGKFLSLMARRGWRVAGVDFDAEAVSHARNTYGLDVEVGTARSCVAKGAKYDIVTASHVIEHVAEPNQFLLQCRQLLRPGGRLILRTPNAESLGHRIYADAWRGLEPPRHLQIFTLSALCACARSAGLRVVSGFTTTAESEAILIMSYFLRRKGSCRPAELSRSDLIRWAVVAPFLAARAKLAWSRDRESGEELYVILEDASSSADLNSAKPQDR